MIVEAAGSIKPGKVFTLQVKMANPAGDPVWPGRSRRRAHHGRSTRAMYIAGKGPEFAGGAHYADDYMTCFLQGSTQYDALGHVWYDDQIWNGYDAKTTIGGLDKASVLAIAEKGVVGRGILLDMARHREQGRPRRGRDVHPRGPEACAEARAPRSRSATSSSIRTGWIAKFYKVSREEFYGNFVEPGLTYSPELVQWFHDMEIPNLVTDTIANEVTVDPVSGVVLPLHNALMRNLGVTLTEIAWLDDLADDCAADGQWTSSTRPRRSRWSNGTGAPVNPIAIK